MAQIGILLLVLGLGTFALDYFDREFTILSWATDYQPWLSVGLAALGLVIVIATKVLGGKDKAPSEG